MGYIYKIENKINQKVYIGETVRNPFRRWYEHIFYSTTPKNNNYALQKAIKKYGKENFSFEVIEECANEDLQEREKYYIQKYNSYIGDGKGYNMTLGGEGAIKIDRQKVYQLWLSGMCCSKIAKVLSSSTATISEILKIEFKVTSEQIQKRASEEKSKYKRIRVKQYSLDGELVKEYPSLSSVGMRNISRAVSTGQKANGYYWIADKSPYTIEQLINGERKNLKCKSVAQYSLEGDLIKVYGSIKEATEATGACKIGEVCNGNRKKSGGYIWKFWNDNTK